MSSEELAFRTRTCLFSVLVADPAHFWAGPYAKFIAPTCCPIVADIGELSEVSPSPDLPVLK